MTERIFSQRMATMPVSGLLSTNEVPTALENLISPARMPQHVGMLQPHTIQGRTNGSNRT